MRSSELSDRNPCEAQLTITASASLTNGCRSRATPWRPVDSLKMSLRLVPLIHSSALSARKGGSHLCRSTAITASWADDMSPGRATIMRASCPASRSASVSRRVTMAAPPRSWLVDSRAIFICDWYDWCQESCLRRVQARLTSRTLPAKTASSRARKGRSSQLLPVVAMATSHSARAERK